MFFGTNYMAMIGYYGHVWPCLATMAVYGRVASFSWTIVALYRLISPYIALYCLILPYIALYRLISPFLAVIDSNSFGLVIFLTCMLEKTALSNRPTSKE